MAGRGQGKGPAALKNTPSPKSTFNAPSKPPSNGGGSSTTRRCSGRAGHRESGRDQEGAPWRGSGGLIIGEELTSSGYGDGVGGSAGESGFSNMRGSPH